jgi:hypothetical protein
MTAPTPTAAPSAARTYRAFPESEIQPQRHTAYDALVYREDESDPTARGKDVWSHTSISGKYEPCRVVYHRHSSLYHCTHEMHARFANRPCRHLSNLLFWQTYERALARFGACTRAELADWDRHFAKVASGLLVPTKGWKAEQTALGDVLCERTLPMEAA